jgi:hypothetical protein
MQSTEGIPLSPAGGRSEQDHYAGLARMIAELTQDHSQLRTFIYEFARVKLRKELYPTFVEGDWTAINNHMRGLEAAIDRIEADFAQNAVPLASGSKPALSLDRSPSTSTPAIASPSSTPAIVSPSSTTRFGEEGIQAHSLIRSRPYGDSFLPIASGGNDRLANAYLGKHLRSRSWRNIQLIIAAAIGLAIYTGYDAKTVLNWVGMHLPARPEQISATKKVETEVDVPVAKAEPGKNIKETPRHRTPDIPLPTEYGAYAVVNGQLAELEQLPIRVPDSRVAISAPISVPSHTHLPAAQSQFIVFRRDLATNSPDRIAVRVVARVMRALTFGREGNAKLVDMEQSWVIRNNSYQMRVAPLGDNPEMILIRPDPTDFSLPPGRYALVLKGFGYDFTVDGPVTDAAQCLERTEALDAPIYSECPNK